MNEIRPCYKRILLKLSGEALMGDQNFGIDPAVLKTVATEISKVHNLGVEMGIVVGGGNIFRGLHAASYGFGRVTADHMGMLATIINALALAEALQRLDCQTRIMTAVDMSKIAEPYVRERAMSHLRKNRLVLFGAGTGNPFFTTDTAAALRAIEINAQILLKGTKVDGVYDADPEKYPSAVPFAELTYSEVLRRNLKVMDLTAISLAMDQNLPIVVFNIKNEGNIVNAVSGTRVGTLIRGVD